MNLNDVIAVNLKRLRTERNLSLGGLAELSGVSKVMLSQIEKGESNPTINTIWKIAVGLQVSYTRLIDSPLDHAMIIRKEESSRQSEKMRIVLLPVVIIRPVRSAILKCLRWKWRRRRFIYRKGIRRKHRNTFWCKRERCGWKWRRAAMICRVEILCILTAP